MTLKRIFPVLVGLFLIGSAIWLWSDLAGFWPVPTAKFCFAGRCFQAELASTPAQQAGGLMFRKKLSSDQGMFFVFEKEKIHAFWMKNTLVPLDIIWLDKNLKIVFIKEGAQPCQTKDCPLFTPSQPATFVLEINAGLAREKGLQAGDQAALLR